MQRDTFPPRRRGAALAAAGAFVLLAVTLAPAAGAAHCGSSVLLEVVVACVYQCGAVYPLGTGVVSYCVTNNGRCPGTIERLPDVYPFLMWCERTGTATCNPPPALLRLEICNQV